MHFLTYGADNNGTLALCPSRVGREREGHVVAFSNHPQIQEHSPNLGDLNVGLIHLNRVRRSLVAQQLAFRLCVFCHRFSQVLDDILWPSQTPTLNCLGAMMDHPVPTGVGPILDQLDQVESCLHASLMRPSLRRLQFAGILYIDRDCLRLHT